MLTTIKNNDSKSMSLFFLDQTCIFVKIVKLKFGIFPNFHSSYSPRNLSPVVLKIKTFFYLTVI